MHHPFFATFFALPLALAGCGAIPPLVTEPAPVQQACTLIGLAVPAAQIFEAQLGAAEQAILNSAKTALGDCAAGNATLAVIDVAAAIENFLAQHGTTKAMLLRRAAR